MRSSRRLLWLAIGVKAATVAMLAFAMTHTEWERFSDKAMGGRAVAYLPALAVIPLVWLVRRRRGSAAPYPALSDLLFSLPFAVDVFGNAADFYDRIAWFDDACHFGNWAMLTGALAAVLPRSLSRAVTLGLCTGMGCLAALGWELAEYATFLRNTPEVATIYTDTLFDMTLGTAGAFLAGLVALLVRSARTGGADVAHRGDPLVADHVAEGRRADGRVAADEDGDVTYR